MRVSSAQPGPGRLLRLVSCVAGGRPQSHVTVLNPKALREDSTACSMHLVKGQAAWLDDEVIANWIIPSFFVLFIIYQVAYCECALSL